jgi:hypothetical protein
MPKSVRFGTNPLSEGCPLQRHWRGTPLQFPPSQPMPWEQLLLRSPARTPQRPGFFFNMSVQPIARMGVLRGPYLGVLIVGSEDDYRKKAEDCLRLADQSSDSVLRETWLKLAEAWRKLALGVSAWRPRPK